MAPSPSPRFMDPTTPPTLLTLVTLASVGAVSMNMILPALPFIQAHFGTSLFTVQFLVSGYLLITGVLQLIIGPLSDYYGRRPLAIVGMAVFTLASIASALAPSAEILIATRLLQALVVASFVLSRAAVRDMLPANQAAAMLGYVAMGMSVAPMLAPTMGGFLQEAFNWPAVFWAQALAGIFVLMLVWRDMGETNKSRSPSLTEQFKQYPDLFRSRRFWGYAFSTALASGCFFVFLGGMPFVGVGVYNMSPAQLGLYFIFTPLGYFCGNFLTGRLSGRFGLLPLLVVAPLIMISGMLLALILVGSGLTHPMAFFAPMLAIGIGNGLSIPNGTAGMMNINPRLAGSAAGLGGSLMTVGGAALSAGVVPFLVSAKSAAPLALFIMATAALSLVAALYTASIERQVRST
ncbi:MAG: multidrug effflux MFS transporter [Pseudomonadota bacterium]